ncbi:pleiotropic drug resistance protein 3-like [Dorcoceras hygrometricum]|uniref:Pleiotropic drug resistance protein 3-like n=1 Tax=Dorcoceras hygrometricum TaxID=472368 RepID=A0A2Z7BWF4_9LAMI|nr:pleiotropic drug resistance protein 3-like [Dorcoceras hygrometricum]
MSGRCRDYNWYQSMVLEINTSSSQRQFSPASSDYPVSDLSCSGRFFGIVAQEAKLVVEMIQLAVAQEIPSRRRGRATRKILAESESQNEEIQRNALIRRRARQVDDETREALCVVRLATGYPAAGSATPFRGPVDGLPFCDSSVRSTGCPALVFSKQRLVVQL